MTILRTRPILIAAACGVAAILALAAILSLLARSRGPRLPTGPITSLEIRRIGSRSGQGPGTMTSVDAPKIEALAALLRAGAPSEDHKCADAVGLTFHLADGGSVRVGYLAGHDGRHDDFRLYSGKDYDIYRVDRPAVRKAMADLGAHDFGD